MAQYYIIFNGQQVGPMEKEQLLSYGLNPNSQVWQEGLPEWVAASTIPELMAMMPAPAPQPQYAAPQPQYAAPQPQYTAPQPQYTAPQPYVGSGKRITFAIIAILIGCFGIQYFVIGKNTAGIVMLLVGLFTCWLGGILEILTLVQGIMVLTMSDQDFDNKFVYTDNSFPLF